MRSTRLWVVATIIAVLILASFVFLVPHAREDALEARPSTLEPNIPTFALRDAFRKGLHTITGSIEVPTVCTEVRAEVSLVGATSSAQSIFVAVSVPEDSGICLQRKSTVQFSTTLTAPANLPVKVLVNGVEATTTDI